MIRYLPEGGAYSPLREQVREMRLQGRSCTEIALRLHIQKDDVRAYCRELGFAEEGSVRLLCGRQRTGVTKCLLCGTALVQPWTGRRKKFCSRACRNKWHDDKKSGRGHVFAKSLETQREMSDCAVTQAPAAKKLRVAAYIRVSTDKESQKESFAVQSRYFQKLLANHPQWEAVGIYADYGSSGTDAGKRVGFLRLLRHCREGKIDHIVTKSISRFTRNTGDFLNTLKLLKEQGVTIFFEKENLSTADSAGEFVVTVLGAVAQEESRSISENIRWGYRKRFQNGEGKNMPVYGYRYCGDNRTVEGGRYLQVQIVEEEAAVVRRIFDDFLSGASYINIARALNRDKITPPDGGWTAAQVAAILLQERYTGDVLLQKTYVADFLSHKEVRNRGERRQYMTKDHHPAIIDRKQFAEARKLADAIRQGKPKKPKERKHSYSFSGLLVCGGCGRFYTVRNRKTNPIWYCPTGFPDNGGGRCRGAKLNEKQVIRLIRQAVFLRFMQTDFMLWETICMEDIFAGKYMAAQIEAREQSAYVFLKTMRDGLEKLMIQDTPTMYAEASPDYGELFATERELIKRKNALAWMRTLPGGRVGMQAFLCGVTAAYAGTFFSYIELMHPDRCIAHWFDGVCTEVTMTDDLEEFWL